MIDQSRIDPRHVAGVMAYVQGASIGDSARANRSRKETLRAELIRLGVYRTKVVTKPAKPVAIVVEARKCSICYSVLETSWYVQPHDPLICVTCAADRQAEIDEALHVDLIRVAAIRTLNAQLFNSSQNEPLKVPEVYPYTDMMTAFRSLQHPDERVYQRKDGKYEVSTISFKIVKEWGWVQCNP